MLGFSYDGFWEELMLCFGSRSAESLFIEEPLIMDCEGEYVLPEEGDGVSGRGRCRIRLYPDAVCVLPQTSHAVRIPLCYVSEFTREGYLMYLRMRTGECYTIGRMGYETEAFFERCEDCRKKTVAKRGRTLSGLSAVSPFLHLGLFRTVQEEEHWAAAFGDGCCAVELYTKDNAATYLYRFQNKEQFVYNLEEAMEAVGSHREIIFLPDEQLNEKPLYRMSLHRSRAVRFLRSCTAGRLIHSASHETKLREFLGN